MLVLLDNWCCKAPLQQALHCLVGHGDIVASMDWHSKAQKAPLEGPKLHLRAAVT